MAVKSLALVLVLLTAGCSLESPNFGVEITATPGPSTPTASIAATSSPTPSTSPSPSPAPVTEPPVTSSPTPQEEPTMPFELTSPAFTYGESIPSEHTCDGADLQLPIEWTGVPDGTAELALIMDDPDARGFVHWIVVGIPADASELADPLIAGARHGQNGFGRARYNGPCPPSGTHTYVTTLYALSQPLELDETPVAGDVRRAAQDVTLATAVLRGTYNRNR